MSSVGQQRQIEVVGEESGLPSTPDISLRRDERRNGPIPAGLIHRAKTASLFAILP
jgi:hypothetical protein